MMSCNNLNINKEISGNEEILSMQKDHFKSDFDIEVNPETFALMVNVNGVSEYVSNQLTSRKVSNFKEENGKILWSYEEEGINILVENKEEYINVSIEG